MTEVSRPSPPDAVRLDVWLDVACVFPTRSQAKAACEGGKVDVNGDRAKPHRLVRPGDRLEVTTGPARRRSLVVRGVAGKSIPKTQARALYEDVTPKPSPDEIEARRFERMSAPTHDPGRPDRRTRREGRRRKGW
ncbi:MAG TPA: RNA-binding S4 domain-containing protein [Thermoanaerobaculia bacterium]